jgi:cysteine desulfuration protein SufE
MDIDEIIETFEFFDDWEDRYRYLIELGRDLEGLDDSDKTEENRVQGCVSNVWLVYTVQAADPVRLAFRADSDAHIVRGLVAVLLAAYSGRSPQQILAIDIRSLFEQLDLASHLSPSRSNGFFAMVERIKGTARGWTQSASAA